MRLEQKARARRLAAALEGKVVEPVTDNEMFVRNTWTVAVAISAIILGITAAITIANMDRRPEAMKQADQMMIERGFVKLAAGTWVSTSCVGGQKVRP